MRLNFLSSPFKEEGFHKSDCWAVEIWVGLGGCLPHCVWCLRSRFFPPTLESKAPSSTIERWWGWVVVQTVKGTVYLLSHTRNFNLFFFFPGLRDTLTFSASCRLDSWALPIYQGFSMQIVSLLCILPYPLLQPKADLSTSAFSPQPTSTHSTFQDLLCEPLSVQLSLNSFKGLCIQFCL